MNEFSLSVDIDWAELFIRSWWTMVIKIASTLHTPSVSRRRRPLSSACLVNGEENCVLIWITFWMTIRKHLCKHTQARMDGRLRNTLLLLHALVQKKDESPISSSRTLREHWPSVSMWMGVSGVGWCWSGGAVDSVSSAEDKRWVSWVLGVNLPHRACF